MRMPGISVLLFALLIALAAPLPGAAENATTTGISRDFNPAISVNTLLLYSSGLGEAEGDEAEEETGHEHAAVGDGFSIQESELQMTSYIDPYAKANLVFAMHGTDGFEMEEGYAKTMFLPKGLGLRAGKFYFEFGKHNCYHTHQYPFVERPYAWDALLGEHGLNGAAIEAAWLTPLRTYTEVIATAFPLTETVYGDEDVPENTWGGAAKLRQFFDSNDGATLDVGISYAGGKAARGGRSNLLGLDITVKWIGTGSNPKSLEIQGETLYPFDERSHSDAAGAYLHALARVTRRWHVGARWDGYLAGDSDGGGIFAEAEAEPSIDDNVHTYTASLAFVPSEFQAFRVDVLRRDLGEESDEGVRVQYNMTIGSHPAHRY